MSSGFSYAVCPVCEREYEASPAWGGACPFCLVARLRARVQAAEMLAAEWESEAKASSAVLGTQLTHTDRAVFSERLATVTGHAMALRRALASPSETRPAESHNPKET